jgi:isoleucyl-tRNA synthetase
MYKKVDTSMNFTSRELEVIDFWRKNDVFKKSVEKSNKSEKVFTFYDGPPTANGQPHLGHVLTRAIKDLIPRYRVMKGYSVLRKAGWDTHGLPVEVEVEKSLGIDGKQDIEKFGIEPFIKECKKSVWKYKKDWEELSERVGFWADMENPYITYDNNYIESEWWALKEIHKKGLLYEGHRIVPYCPRCGTALSSHEVDQGYKDVKEKSIVVKFPKKDEDNTYFLAWTTTPWTLPSNTALCMHPEHEYAKIKSNDTFYIMAKELIEKHFEEGSYDIVEVKKGKDYERAAYKPLFDFQKEKNSYFVTNDEYVTLTDGTGIVHIAPAFGEDDSKVGKKYGLSFVQMVDDSGRFKKEAEPYTGQFCKEADKDIIKDLNAKGLLFSELMYEHSYPFCWRCDTPLLYYARKSWFIKMTALRDRLVELNKTINWMPPTIGSGRMGNFLENVVDWSISRERYWGTPVPFWKCENGHLHVVGSRAELAQLSGCDENIELHRPYIDQVTFPCPECGKTMKRSPEVMDCWFDSGSMPYAQHHYPFENKELFEKHFPADFISEAVDQTRGWFYNLSAISTLLFDSVSFKNCIVLGLVGDKNGVKMSKHKGNGVAPEVPLNKQGADALRWFFYTNSQPWLPSRYYDDAISEAQRKFLGTLWNAYAFFVLYADIDKFDPSKYSLKDCKLSLMDKWLLSKLNSLVKFVDEGLNNYEITETARAIENFTDELSNWYIRRSRERYWGKEWTDDKQAAFVTLHHTLSTLAKVAAPYVPFVTEQIYQNIERPFFKDAPISVHLCDYPKYDVSYIDTNLEKEMEKVEAVVVLGRNCRNQSSIKNRQPLSAMYVIGNGYDLKDEFAEIALVELNVKQLIKGDKAEEFISFELKPQLKTLGPKYGKLIGQIKEYLASCDAQKVVDEVKRGTHKFTIDGQEVEVGFDDLLITSKSKEGFSAASERGLTVALDTTLTKELIDLGLVRELISKIQTLRKELDFVVTDHIMVGIKADNDFMSVVKEHAEEIMESTLADSLEWTKGEERILSINGYDVTILMEKAK